MFISRHPHGTLLQFDYESYHIRLIAKMVGYEFPKGISAHQHLASLYRCDYETAKKITFTYLYGGLDENAREIPFFQKVDVNGKNEHPLFSALKGNEKRNYSDFSANQTDKAIENQNLAGQAIARISHGYEKFLVSREGIMVARFNWQDMPLDEIPRIMGAGWTVREAIDELLG
jgi:hypothetical protein